MFGWHAWEYDCREELLDLGMLLDDVSTAEIEVTGDVYIRRDDGMDYAGKIVTPWYDSPHFSC